MANHEPDGGQIGKWPPPNRDWPNASRPDGFETRVGVLEAQAVDRSET